MKELISHFLEFPGILITLSILSFMMKRKKMFLFFAILIYVLTAPIFWLPVQRIWTVKSKQIKAPIVILGGGLVEIDGDIFPSRSTLMRLEKGFELWKEFKTEIVVSGRGIHDVAEADLMASILKGWGVPKEYVIVEGGSMNTLQNAEMVSRILKVKRINLVTSALHMRRSLLAFRSFGFDPVPVPTDYVLSTKTNFRAFLPRAETLNFLSSLTHEVIGYIYYSIYLKLLYHPLESDGIPDAQR